MCWLSAWKSRLLVARGDLAGAERVLRERGLTLDGEFYYPREVEYLAFARLLMAKDLTQPKSAHLSDAKWLLSRLQERLESMGWVDKVLEAQVLRALILQAQGQDRAALEMLAEVLVVAEPEGYTRLFVREGPPMARLLYRALERGVAAQYVSHLLSIFSMPTPEPAPSRPQAKLVEPLSERELDVLRLVAGGATNRETALSLHLALGTVKNHLKNIYGKLNVHSRTQATARGRDLGLID
jgi:LuxR family maltose regulon positive regulatory protein